MCLLLEICYQRVIWDASFRMALHMSHIDLNFVKNIFMVMSSVMRSHQDFENDFVYLCVVGTRPKRQFKTYFILLTKQFIAMVFKHVRPFIQNFKECVDIFPIYLFVWSLDAPKCTKPWTDECRATHCPLWHGGQWTNNMTFFSGQYMESHCYEYENIYISYMFSHKLCMYLIDHSTYSIKLMFIWCIIRSFWGTMIAKHRS